MMKRIAFLLLPSLALSANVTGTVSLLDGTPVAGAVVKIGKDTIVSSANGSFTLGRSTGIASRPGKTIPVTSHLTIENGRPRLTFAGMDIRGRELSAAPVARIEHRSDFQPANAARSVATRDTLKLFWKGKRLLVLPLSNDTTVAIKLDTAWKSDGNNPFNPHVQYGSLLDYRDDRVYRTVTIGKQTWMAENLSYGVTTKNMDRLDSLGGFYNYNSSRNVCPEGWHLPSTTEWKTLFKTIGMTQKAIDSAYNAQWSAPEIARSLSSTNFWWWETKINSYFIPTGIGTDEFGMNITASSCDCSWGANNVFTTSGSYRINSYGSTYIPVILINPEDGIIINEGHLTGGFSVRCVQDTL